MAKVIVVDKYDATVKAFKTVDRYEADLYVKIVSSQYEANGDQFWFFVDSPYDASTKLHWVDSPYDADIKVFVTDDPYDAGWKKSNNRQNSL
ncbi:MAG: DUF6150 family protein [Sulfuritalea sp.]|nr:DUF6150 family protein [Sulfuritalea sp.]